MTRHPDLSQRPLNRQVIGWRERVSFPEWGIENLRAKIDTGARTSALHVANIVDLGDGQIEFEVVLGRRDGARRVPVRARVLRVSRIKPSSGRVEERYVVPALIRLGSRQKTIEVSLVSREGMICRMLLGRTALGHDYLADPSRKYLLEPKKPRKSSSGAFRGERRASRPMERKEE